MAKDGKSISYLQSIPDTTKIESLKVNVFDTQKETTSSLFDAKGTIKKLSNDKAGNSVSFLFSSDTSKVKVYDLWLSRNYDKAAKIIEPSNSAMPNGWSASENGNITFSDDGSTALFGTARKPVKEPEDTLLDEEKYKLDIWSWDDDLLQPMQKKQLDEENKRTYMAVYQCKQWPNVPTVDTIIPSCKNIPEGQ